MGPQSTTPTTPTPRLPLVLRWALALLLTAPLAAQSQRQATAPLLLPSAIAYDAQGNLYIAEVSRHDIRKLDTAGNVTIIAGTGTQGYSGDNGPAVAAELDSPQGIAIDPTGNLYLADSHNHRIREIAASTGIITTIAGTGSAGNSGDNGPATAATLRLPRGVAIDASGNLYLADYTAQRIRKINASTGQITTIAGSGTQGFSGDNGPATVATLDSPRATAISPSGLATFADAANQRIRQLDSASTIHTIAGPGAISPTNPANAPVTIALTASSTSITAGQPITITATVSTPTGVPTGTVTLYDDSVALATIALPPSGQITYSTTALTTGANTITASYSGDANFAKSISSPATVAVNTVSGTTTGGGSDFTLAAKDATTQTLLPGTSASFTFTLQSEGSALSSPVTLSASGVPSLYTASFNPAYLPPGAASGTITLTIAAKTTNALQKNKSGSSAILAFLAFPLTLFGIRHRTTQKRFSRNRKAPILKEQNALPDWRRRVRDEGDKIPIELKGQRPASYQPGAQPQVSGIFNEQRAEGPIHSIFRDAGILLLLLVPSFLLLGCGARINTAGQNTPTATPYTITVTGTATTPAGTTLQHSTTVTLLIQQSN